MSQTNTLLVTIGQDIRSIGGWLEEEAEKDGLLLWQLLKTTFQNFTAGQFKIVHDLLGKIEEDVLSGKSLEDLETDLLNLASTEELELLESIASSDMQAIISMFKSAKGF